jgi:uncharacterized protein YrzB (UPF0473 family)
MNVSLRFTSNVRKHGSELTFRRLGEFEDEFKTKVLVGEAERQERPAEDINLGEELSLLQGGSQDGS